MNLELSARDAPVVSLDRPIDSSKIAYQLPQPMGQTGRSWVTTEAVKAAGRPIEPRRRGNGHAHPA
jgi:hypothetical protein